MLLVKLPRTGLFGTEFRRNTETTTAHVQVQEKDADKYIFILVPRARATYCQTNIGNKVRHSPTFQHVYHSYLTQIVSMLSN